MKEYPRRKQNRLEAFDYASDGAYFLTICTAGRRCILGDVVGAHSVRPPFVQLSKAGRIVDAAIRAIPEHYQGVLVEKYVIMPNHVHMILRLESIPEKGIYPPAIHRIVKQMKEAVTKQAGVPVWQNGFYDHVIRNQSDFDEIWRYIDENPIKWTLDRYYEE